MSNPDCLCRCAIDQEPRKLSTQQLSILANLAEMVVRRIERDKQILIQQHSKTSLLRTLRNQQEAVFMCDTAMSGWPILFTNKSCQEMLDWTEGALGGRGVWDVFRVDPGCKVGTPLTWHAELGSERCVCKQTRACQIALGSHMCTWCRLHMSLCCVGRRNCLCQCHTLQA